MTASAFGTQVSGVITSATLVAVGVAHLIRPRYLTGALSAQGIVPQAMVRPCAAIVVLLELSIGGVVLAHFLAGETTALYLPAVAAMAGLYGVFSGYSYIVLRTRPGVPCGCGDGDAPVTGWVAGRAALYAVLTLAVLRAEAGPVSDREIPELGLLTMASAGLAILLWILPSAVATTAGRVP